MTSPSFTYSHPPPPYSHPSSASAAPPGQSVLISPPASRRTSGDDVAPIQSAGQSLPSIHEALRGTDPASYQTQTAAAPTFISSFYQSQAVSSMPDHQRSNDAPTLPPQQEPRHTYSQPPSQSPSYISRPPQAMHAPHTPTTSADILSRPPLYQQQPKLPTLQPIRTVASPVSAPRPNLAYQSQQPSPSFEPASGTQSAQPGTPYGYSSGFPPQGQFTFSHPMTSSGPMYQNQTAGTLSQPTTYPAPPVWRRDEEPRAEERHGYGIRPEGQQYVDSVKRHLDQFDLEASYQEV